MKKFIAFIAIAICLISCLAYAEEEYFDTFGFQIYNEKGQLMKFLYDKEHQMLRVRVFESIDTEVYYEGEIPLIRIWEGWAEE